MNEYTKRWIQFIIMWILIIAVFMGIMGIVFSLYSVSGMPKNPPIISDTLVVHNVAKISIPENATVIANGVYRLANGSLMGCKNSTDCEIFDMEKHKVKLS